MARVMEFQFLSDLKIDGIAGPATLSLIKDKSKRCLRNKPVGRSILADLIYNKAFAYVDGNEKIQIRTLGHGGKETPTDLGVFKVGRRELVHYSSQFNNAPMPFSLFFNKGEAFHEGDPNSPSHGCIHLKQDDAKKLFNWVKDKDVRVFVVKLH